MNIEDIPENIYLFQKENCIRLSLPMPEYSLDELKDWLDNDLTWNVLFVKWMYKNCPKHLTPRVYRIDTTKPYTLDNLAVSTTYELHKKD